jgi:pimeloyl-ACP methyl ester carboxylesterase
VKQISRKTFWRWCGCSALVAVFFLAPFLMAGANFVHETFLTKDYDPNQHHVKYKVIGKGERKILLIHGFAGASTYWSTRLPNEDATFIVPDLLGFGDSPKPVATYSLQLHVKALKEITRVHSPIDTIIGHSMGAIIAIELARQLNPKRLVLVSLPLFKDRQQAIESLGRVSMMHQGMVEEDPLMKASCFFRNSYKLPFLANLFDLPVDVYLSGTDHTWNSLSTSLTEVILNSPTKQMMQDYPGKLLFVHGEKDKVAPMNNVREANLALRHSFTVISGGDHNFFLKDPHKLWKEIF